jgi:hypothetical protein
VARVKVRRSTKLAVTVLSASMVTMHDLVPEHAPVQLEKAYTEVPVAVTVTWTPGSWVVVPGGVRVPPADGLAVVVREYVSGDGFRRAKRGATAEFAFKRSQFSVLPDGHGFT